MKKEVRPRDFLERMTLSKSWMSGELAGLVSRSWMNSLNAVGDVSLDSREGLGGSTLRMFQHSEILLLFIGQASEKSIHVKAVQLATALLLLCWSV